MTFSRSLSFHLRSALRAAGIGDPLVATYTRAYLARRGVDIAPSAREYLPLQSVAVPVHVPVAVTVTVTVHVAVPVLRVCDCSCLDMHQVVVLLLVVDQRRFLFQMFYDHLEQMANITNTPSFKTKLEEAKVRARGE